MNVSDRCQQKQSPGDRRSGAYLLVSNLQGTRKIKNIRGTSMFGTSFVFVIF